MLGVTDKESVGIVNKRAKRNRSKASDQADEDPQVEMVSAGATKIDLTEQIAKPQTVRGKTPVKSPAAAEIEADPLVESMRKAAQKNQKLIIKKPTKGR